MLGRDKKMNPGRYFIPNMGMGMQMGPMMNGMAPMTRGVGLFGRIGNTLKSINFSGLLSGANKTLNVVNQTIPLIRQAKPMVNNMKSMFKLAKAFGSETVSRNGNQNYNANGNSNTKISANNKKNENVEDNSNSDTFNSVHDSNNNYPNFFI